MWRWGASHVSIACSDYTFSSSYSNSPINMDALRVCTSLIFNTLSEIKTTYLILVTITLLRVLHTTASVEGVGEGDFFLYVCHFLNNSFSVITLKMYE